MAGLPPFELRSAAHRGTTNGEPVSIFSPSWRLMYLAILVARSLQDVGSVLRMLSGGGLGWSEQPGLTGEHSIRGPERCSWLPRLWGPDYPVNSRDTFPSMSMPSMALLFLSFHPSHGLNTFSESPVLIDSTLHHRSVSLMIKVKFLWKAASSLAAPEQVHLV